MMRALKTFASVHASFQNHFSRERHFVDRRTYKNPTLSRLGRVADPHSLTQAGVGEVRPAGDKLRLV